MLNLIRADFYKLFRMKSFYICGLLGVALSLLGIWATNLQFNGLPVQLFGYSGVTALMQGLSSGALFYTIFISLFVPNEFSFGTIKNMISSGQSRVSIYLSKVIIGIFTVASYVIINGVASLILGNILWGSGDFSRDDYLKILRMIALFIFVEVTMQCFFVMIGFLIRKSGGTVATNLLSTMFIAGITTTINFLAYKWFNIENLKSDKYLPSFYSNVFLSLDIPQEEIITGLIVCVVAIIIFSSIGIWTFIKRDIKE